MALTCSRLLYADEWFAVVCTDSVYEGEVLRFSKISRLDMGVYVCTASNGVPPAASRNIMVNIHCKHQSIRILPRRQELLLPLSF